MTDDTDKDRPRPATGKAKDDAGKPALRLVHSAASNPPPQAKAVKIRHSRNDDDDPGPSAA